MPDLLGTSERYRSGAVGDLAGTDQGSAERTTSGHRRRGVSTGTTAGMLSWSACGLGSAQSLIVVVGFAGIPSHG